MAPTRHLAKREAGSRRMLRIMMLWPCTRGSPLSSRLSLGSNSSGLQVPLIHTAPTPPVASFSATSIRCMGGQGARRKRNWRHNQPGSPYYRGSQQPAASYNSVDLDFFTNADNREAAMQLLTGPLCELQKARSILWRSLPAVSHCCLAPSFLFMMPAA